MPRVPRLAVAVVLLAAARTGAAVPIRGCLESCATARRDCLDQVRATRSTLAAACTGDRGAVRRCRADARAAVAPDREACRRGRHACGECCRSGGSDCAGGTCEAGAVDPHAGCPDLAGGACDALPARCGPAEDACTPGAAELEAVVAFLADDAQEGRGNGTPGSARVQEFLEARLAMFAAGGAPGGGFRHPFAAGTNLVARIPGRGTAGGEVVLLGAHYDHLGQHGSVVFNGATDNATGVAAVLAVGRLLARLPEPPARAVVLALWDAEEDGLLGSEAWATDPAVDLGAVAAYVNLDILGAAPVRGSRRRTFVVGVDTSPAFPPLLADFAAGDALAAGGFSNLFGQDRSDHATFVRRGVPSLFVSDTTGGCYHTPGDDVGVVHVGKALRQTWLAFRLVHALADAPARPSFAAPRPLPGYADAAVLRDTLASGLCEAAGSGLDAGDVATVEGWIAALDAIDAAGPATFTPAKAITIGLTALDAIDLLTSLPCQPN
jgi:hypothetical protein